MVRAVTGRTGAVLAFVGCPWPVSGPDAGRVVVVGGHCPELSRAVRGCWCPGLLAGFPPLIGCQAVLRGNSVRMSTIGQIRD